MSKTAISTVPIVLLTGLLAGLVPTVAATPDDLCLPEGLIVLGGHCAYAELYAEDVLVPAPAETEPVANLWEIHFIVAGQDFDIYLVAPEGVNLDCQKMFEHNEDFSCGVDKILPLVKGELTDQGAICSGNAVIVVDNGDDDERNDFRTDVVPYARVCFPPV